MFLKGPHQCIHDDITPLYIEMILSHHLKLTSSFLTILKDISYRQKGYIVSIQMEPNTNSFPITSQLINPRKKKMNCLNVCELNSTMFQYNPGVSEKIKPRGIIVALMF